MSVRELLLADLELEPSAAQTAMTTGRLRLGDQTAVAALWDFGVRGGSCGVAEADAFETAVTLAIGARLPLVTVLASGGTRLTEGMRALVGIPRMVLALDQLRAARLPHICIADAPTTGGVWVAVGCSADLRAGVEGATVAFSGPRVVEAMTGRPPAAGSATAASAYRSGQLDALVTEVDAVTWLSAALQALATGSFGGQATREPGEFAEAAVSLAGADDSARAKLGRARGKPAVIVDFAAEPGGFVTAAGFDLLARAANLADTVDAPLVTRIDTLGGDPHDDGVAPAILRATRAMLACRPPTVAVVAGAGGSGGALAAAVTDTVIVGPRGWFAALVPAGAAAALRRGVDEVAALMRISPGELVEDGFADTAYDDDTHELAVVGQALTQLLTLDEADRLRTRLARWSAPLPSHDHSN